MENSNPANYKPMLISMGQRIRWARIRKQMRQHELAKEMGVNQSSVTLWEGGKTIPRDIDRLADILEVEPGWLRFGAVTIDGLSDKTLAFAVRFEELDEQEQRAIMAMIRGLESDDEFAADA